MVNCSYQNIQNIKSFIEGTNKSKYERRCIDGVVTSSSNCIGYCQYSRHPGFITLKLLKQHNCIGKRCDYYIGKPPKEKKRIYPIKDQSNEILSYLQTFIDCNTGIKVIRVVQEYIGLYKAFFITITNDYTIEEYVQYVNDRFFINIEFIRLNYDFEKAIALMFA